MSPTASIAALVEIVGSRIRIVTVGSVFCHPKSCCRGPRNIPSTESKASKVLRVMSAVKASVFSLLQGLKLAVLGHHAAVLFILRCFCEVRGFLPPLEAKSCAIGSSCLP